MIMVSTAYKTFLQLLTGVEWQPTFIYVNFETALVQVQCIQKSSGKLNLVRECSAQFQSPRLICPNDSFAVIASFGKLERFNLINNSCSCDNETIVATNQLLHFGLLCFEYIM